MASDRRELEKVLFEEGAREKLYRFIAESDPEKCWEWSGKRTKQGYGAFYYKGCTITANRASLIIHTEFSTGRSACHKCNNPPCVNPNHLYWGTAKDNMRDLLKNGGMRNLKGCKLDEEKVRLIRTSTELTDEQMAGMFGVTKDAIFYARTGVTWKWVEPHGIRTGWWRRA